MIELAARLREQARATNERRMLVLTGSPSRTREYAQRALAETDIDPGSTTYIGPEDGLACECIPADHASWLLGTTRDAIVLDLHDRCEPNTIGRLVGTVDGGGLFVLLVPPLSRWPERRDSFDATLAVPPFDRSDVRGNFRRRLVETLSAHRGIAIVDVDSDTVEADGSIESAPRRPRPEPTVPSKSAFPRATYERCLTQDQVDAVSAFELLAEPGNAVVVSANRGRGKSSAAGLAAASLSLDGRDVLVTAPRYRNARELFTRARELLDDLGALDRSGDRDAGRDDRHVDGPGTCTGTPDEPRYLETDQGRIRFHDPGDATALPGSPDCVIVDEAAALPVRYLAGTLDAPGVAYTTTTHGYEGAGRGFTVRFRDHLDRSSLSVTDVTMAEPIRYAPGDPVEVWSFRALVLDARPPVRQLVDGAIPASVTYRELSPTDLLADETLLREVFGLLVLAHYRTEPNDLARILDAPNVSVHALVDDGHVVSVALLAREGNLPESLRSSMYRGTRVRGNLVPDVLTSQLRDEGAGEPTGLRVMRIATHEAVRSQGLGSTLLDEIRRRASGIDWLGVGYGTTPELVNFWEENGFSSVHLSTTRNERSGEHSAIMLRPLSPSGRALLDRHTDWLLRRLPDMLADALSDVDPDVVRAVCRTIDGTPALELTEWEWRHAVAVADGPGIFEMAPRPVRQLTFRHLVAPARDALSSTEERVLVMRALQTRSREDVADALGFASAAECMRTLGDAVDTLLDLYGDGEVERERDRLR